jgi:hypothetical protein
MTITADTTNTNVAGFEPTLLTDAQAAVLGALLTRPGGTAAEIADAAGVSASATGKALLLLVDLGLAVRTAHEPVGGKRIAATWELTGAALTATKSTADDEEQQQTETAGDAAVAHMEAEASGPDSASGTGAPVVESASQTKVAAMPGVPLPSGRLRSGGLRALVVEQLTARPEDEFSPTMLSRILERSSGAIANCLDILVNSGFAELTCEKPRRFRHVATPGNGF